MKTSHNILAGLLVAGGLAVSTAAANAVPLSSIHAPATVTANADLQQVRYGDRGWHRGHRGPSIYFGFGRPGWQHHRRHHWGHRGHW